MGAEHEKSRRQMRSHGVRDELVREMRHRDGRSQLDPPLRAQKGSRAGTNSSNPVVPGNFCFISVASSLALHKFGSGTSGCTLFIAVYSFQ